MKKRYVAHFVSFLLSLALLFFLFLSFFLSASLFLSGFDREIHTGRRFEYSRPSYDQRGNGFIVAALHSPPRVILMSLRRCLGPDNRHRARGTRSGTILAFHTAKTPMPRSTYPVLCVKRTGKQNLRLFRGNKNGRAREARRNRVSRVRVQFRRRAYLAARSERAKRRRGRRAFVEAAKNIFVTRHSDRDYPRVHAPPFVSSALPSFTRHLRRKL